MSPGLLQWDAIIEDLAPKLFRYFCSAFDRNVADDLVQETLIRLYRKVTDGSFQESQGSLAGYAFGVAHLIRLEQRKRFVKLPVPTEAIEQIAVSGVESPESQCLLGERNQQLRYAITKLSEAEQSVITLLVDRDLKLADIAEVLAMPLNTVKSHMLRSKEKIKKVMRDGGYYDPQR